VTTTSPSSTRPPRFPLSPPAECTWQDSPTCLFCTFCVWLFARVYVVCGGYAPYLYGSILLRSL
jgi:hypothetical protein